MEEEQRILRDTVLLAWEPFFKLCFFCSYPVVVAYPLHCFRVQNWLARSRNLEFSGISIQCRMCLMYLMPRNAKYTTCLFFSSSGVHLDTMETLCWLQVAIAAPVPVLSHLGPDAILLLPAIKTVALGLWFVAASQAIQARPTSLFIWQSQWSGLISSKHGGEGGILETIKWVGRI